MQLQRRTEEHEALFDGTFESRQDTFSFGRENEVLWLEVLAMQAILGAVYQGGGMAGARNVMTSLGQNF